MIKNQRKQKFFLGMLIIYIYRGLHNNILGYTL